jgi:hypothetical protein
VEERLFEMNLDVIRFLIVALVVLMVWTPELDLSPLFRCLQLMTLYDLAKRTLVLFDNIKARRAT